MTIIRGYDAIHASIGHLPPGQVAGYTTGSGGIAWSAADWQAHPGAVRIDQDALARDTTADVLDVERGAATNALAAGWFKAALLNWSHGVRPGQRVPAFYTSRLNVTPLVNALKAGGVPQANLWVADWNLAEWDAAKLVESAGGPYPIVGVQYQNTQYYDLSVFSVAWLNKVSKAPSVPTPPIVLPPTSMTGESAMTILAATDTADRWFWNGTHRVPLTMELLNVLRSRGVPTFSATAAELGELFA